MKLLAVVTPPPDIYHGCSTRKTLLEEKFIPLKMISCVRRNVRKHREINNGEQYISLGISYKLECLNKREFTSPQSRYYMVRPCKGMTASLSFSTKSQKNSKFVIADITNQYLMYFQKKFKNSSYLCYKQKQVDIEPTEAYSFLIKQIIQKTKIKSHVCLHTKGVKSGVKKQLNMPTKQFNFSNWKAST